MIGNRSATLKVYSIAYDRGRQVITETTSTIRGSIQPATGEVLESLDGDTRARDVRILRVHRQQVDTVNPRTSKKADGVVVDGDLFIVHEVRNWPSMLRYREIVLVRQVESASEGAA